MAYRFNGTTGVVEFAIAPFSGYTFGPFTLAMFLLRNSINSNFHDFISVTDAGITTTRLGWKFVTANTQTVNSDGGGGITSAGGAAITSTTIWNLIAVTKAAGTATPRFHIHDGTSWAHSNGDVPLQDSASPIAANDRLRVSKGTLSADLACVGIKKANSSDLVIETLSRTSFQAWRNFTFDWLIGFDTTLTSGGLLQDQASPGTGDEISKVNTSVVADPPAWSFGAAAGATGLRRRSRMRG